MVRVCKRRERELRARGREGEEGKWMEREEEGRREWERER